LFAAAGYYSRGSIYISTNSGASWSVTAAAVTNWFPLAVSADGRKVAAAVGASYSLPIYTSSDAGATWQSQKALPYNWQTLASSADGTKLFATAYTDMAMLQTTPTPQLKATRFGQQLLLSWIVPSTASRLESAIDPLGPQWNEVTNPPTLNFTNLNYQITVPITNPAAFYRLTSQ
jgi:hypothetical protein